MMMKRIQFITSSGLFFGVFFAMTACNNPLTGNANTSNQFNPGISGTPAAPVITSAGGDSQTVYLSTSLDQPLQAKVLTISGSPVANVPIDWTITSGGGVLGTASSVTDATGVASNTWTASATPGTVILQASVHGLSSSIQFSEKVSAGSPEILASNFVATEESTSSNSAASLTTADSVSFNLSTPTTVYIDFRGLVFQSGGVVNASVVANIDGTDDVANASTLSTGNGFTTNANLVYPKLLASGMHTIKIHYSTPSGSVSWLARRLLVRKIAGQTLATSWVSTPETIPGAGNVVYDLTTLDSVTFTLSATTTVLVDYTATMSVGGGTQGNVIYVDGVEDSSQANAGNNSPLPSWSTSLALVPETLSAGVHTITIKHTSDNSGAAWGKRLLRITRIASPTSFYNDAPATETYTSATPGDLPTPEILTFNLLQDTDVLIDYGASGAIFSSGVSLMNNLELDGVLLTTQGTANFAAHWNSNTIYYKTHLTAGSHTIHIQHWNTTATANDWWNNRMLHVTAVN